jgi:hypothetical protein
MTDDRPQRVRDYAQATRRLADQCVGLGLQALMARDHGALMDVINQQRGVIENLAQLMDLLADPSYCPPPPATMPEPMQPARPVLRVVR